MADLDAQGVHAEPREVAVVAVVLQWRHRVALFKRSQQVTHDQGLWHCVTGYLEQEVQDPRLQAILELYEETGLAVSDLDEFTAGPVLKMQQCAITWKVHTFRAETRRRRLNLNWEHDSYRWVPHVKVQRFAGRVGWLDEVLAATAASHQPSPTNHT